MKVRALQPHSNKYGESFRKAEGDEYEAPDRAAESLAAQGLVELVEEEAEPAAKPKRAKAKQEDASVAGPSEPTVAG